MAQRAILLAACVGLMVVWLPSPVMAQGGFDPNAPPNYGDAILLPGFSPDPYTVRMASGGAVDVRAALADQCTGSAQGYVSSAPDYRIKYAGSPQDRLRFFFVGNGDTTLVIRAPDHRWFCDDDSGGVQNPLLTFEAPLRGWYNVWVGSYAFGETITGDLYVTAQDRTPNDVLAGGGGGVIATPLPGGGLNPAAEPSYGAVSLAAGFLPDPHRVRLASGGSVDVRANLGAVCRGAAWGYAASAPDYRVQYAAGAAARLRFFFVGDADTTLIVNGPDGLWTCDDDSGGARNPLITFENPAGGSYSVWVGSYNLGETVNGTLFVTEQDQGPANYLTESGAAGLTETGTGITSGGPTVISGFDPQAAATNYGAVSLTAGFLPDPYQVRMMSGGGVDVRANLQAFCMGDAQGYAASAPDYRVQYAAGSAERLRFFFIGDGDTTLVVRGPGEKWACDDDSGGAQNPLITFSAPLSGQYDVWVGSYALGDFISGTLYITGMDVTPANYP